MARPVLLAKLTRPKVYQAISRPRLFERIDDETRLRPALCVLGPPGSGKTTLIASWLDTQRRPGLWYQIDSGDHDAATFFYYLNLALEPFLPKRARRLPLLTPEYLSDLPGYTRRYFRALFNYLPRNSSLVLDNYQEVPAHEPFHTLISLAISEIPPDRNLIIVSRHDPPDCYARLIANEHVGFLDWDELRLTAEETRALLVRRAAGPRVDVDEVYRATQGWAAGLTLMIERTGRLRQSDHDLSLASREAVFSYFATELFKDFKSEDQQVLMCCAILPWFTSHDAAQVSGNQHAESLLERLFRQRFFTDRRLRKHGGGGSSDGSASSRYSYQFHPLFQEFLLERLNALLAKEQIRELRLRAARVLAAAGNAEAAIELCSVAKAWTLALEIALEGARSTLGQGRWRTVLRWFDQLPLAEAEQVADFHYWRGLAVLNADLAEARVALTRALDEYRRSQDIVGQLLTIAAISRTHWIEDGVSKEWKPWIGPMELLLRDCERWPTTTAELVVRTSFLQMTVYYQPSHDLIPENAARVVELAEASNAPVGERLAACVALTTLFVPAGDLRALRRVMTVMDQLLDSRDVTPLNLGIGLCFKAYGKIIGFGQYEDGLLDLNAAEELAGRERLPAVTRSALEFRCYACLIFGRRVAEGAEHLRVAESIELRGTSNRSGTRTDNRMRVAEWNGDFALARTYAAQALTFAREHSPVFLLMLGSHYAHCFARVGESSVARALIVEVRSIIRGTCFANFEATLVLEEGLVEHYDGHSAAALDLIREGLERARQCEADAAVLHWLGHALVQVCQLAIEGDVEPDYVRELIVRWDIPMPKASLPSWPWPLSVQTLGQFVLHKRGQPMSYGRKVPRKILHLLKVVIAFGASDVPEEKIIDLLWPDQDGDLAYARYKRALARLRDLLGEPDALRQRDRRLSIDLGRCRIDTLELQSLGESLERSAALDEEQARHWLKLYKGDFLEEEIDLPWAVAVRTRLRERFLRGIEVIGAALESTGRHDVALTFYRRGSEVGSSVNRFQRHLDRCLAALR